MHIELTKLLKINPFNIKYNSKERFCKGCISANQGYNSEIEKAMTANNNKDDDEKNSQKKQAIEEKKVMFKASSSQNKNLSIVRPRQE